MGVNKQRLKVTVRLERQLQQTLQKSCPDFQFIPNQHR
jgi:hypothetical protein